MAQEKKYDIFISYRKDDNWHQAQHICTLLANEYPSLNISLDSHNLHGRWFPNLIERIDTCKKFIVLISENSLHYPFQDSIQEKMYRDLAQCSFDEIVTRVKELKKNNVSIDYFRLEIARMLCKQDVTIVPVLLAKGTNLFTIESLKLPDDIVELSDHQSVSFVDNKINTEELPVIIPSIKRLLYPHDADDTGGTSVIAEKTHVNARSTDDFDFKKTLAEVEDYVFHNGFYFVKDYENMGLSLTNANAYFDSKTINIPGTVTIDGIDIAVTSIGDAVFSNYDSIVVVDIPDTVRTIGAESFRNCKELRFVKLSKNTTTIGTYAFAGCSLLKEITIPETVKKIRRSAFLDCVSLQSLEIPEKVELIEGCAFKNCESLSHISILGIESLVRPSAFDGCNSIQKLMVSRETRKRCFTDTPLASINYIDGAEDGDGIDELSSKGIVEVFVDSFKSTFKSEELQELKEIEGSKEGMRLFAIMVAIELLIALIICCVVCSKKISKGDVFFANGSYEKAVRKYSSAVAIPTLSIIDKGDAFYKLAYCSEKGYGTIKDYNQSFKYYQKAANRDNAAAMEKIARCYENGDLGVEIDINKSKKKYIKLSKKHLQFINVGKNKVSVGDGVYNYNAEKIIIPSKYNKSWVVGVEDYAFSNCSNLVEIILPNSITSIGAEAFSDCSSLRDLTIRNNIKSIGVSAFSGCSSLNSIVVNEGNPIYDSRGNCNAIIETSTNKLIVGCMNTTIPENVTSIGAEAFSGCDSLKSISIPDGVNSIGNGAFMQCSSLETVAFSGSVVKIGASAFAQCYNLDSVVMSNGIETIESGAFVECFFLSSITIPNSVKYIGDWVFDSCSSLSSIYFRGTKQQWNSVIKGKGWEEHVVHCTDGDVEM